MKRARAKARDWSLDIFRGCAKDSPPWRRRGGRAIKNCSRSFERRGRGGWFKQPLIFWTNTTPSAPSKVASQHFLDGAATPPQLRRGIRTHVSLPRHTRGRSLKLKASMLLLLTKSSPKCPNSRRGLKPATTSLATFGMLVVAALARVQFPFRTFRKSCWTVTTRATIIPQNWSDQFERGRRWRKPDELRFMKMS